METIGQPDLPSRRGPPERGRNLVCGAALCVLGAGCAGLSEHIAEEAAPVATEEAVQTIAEPDNARAVAQLLTDPAVKAAIRDVSREAVRGMLALPGEAGADVRERSDKLVRAVMPSLASGIRRDLSPALAGAVREGTEAAFAEAFSPANLGRARAFGASITEETVHTLSGEAAAVLVPDVVSSLFASADAAAGTLDLARIGNAVGEVSYAAAREAVLGANDGLRGLRQDGDRFFLASVGSEIERTLTRLLWLAAPLGLLLVVATLSLAWLAYAIGRDRLARAQRDEAVGLVMHLLRVSEDKPWAAELRELLREADRGAMAEPRGPRPRAPPSG